MANRNLTKAKEAKKDEFYTQLEDINNELRHYREHFSGIWTIFRFEYPERAMIQNVPETIQKTIRKTIQKKLSKQQEAILIYLRKHPDATRKELVENIPDTTMGGIIHNLSRLQELGFLKRVGGRKQGFWQIVEL